jgi:hypothetical protein
MICEFADAMAPDRSRIEVIEKQVSAPGGGREELDKIQTTLKVLS